VILSLPAWQARVILTGCQTRAGPSASEQSARAAQGTAVSNHYLRLLWVAPQEHLRQRQLRVSAIRRVDPLLEVRVSARSCVAPRSPEESRHGLLKVASGVSPSRITYVGLISPSNGPSPTVVSTARSVMTTSGGALRPTICARWR
jgi:hypothetical protein